MEFIRIGRMSYLVLRGRWCDIKVLRAHVPTEDETDDSDDVSMRN